MTRRLPITAAAWVLAAPSAPVAAQLDLHRTDLHDLRIVTVAEGLEAPWAIGFLPDGEILVTERPGRLRVIRGGRLLPDPVPGVPRVVARGQGGLLDVEAHPDFATNRTIYLSYSKPTPDHRWGTTAVVRGIYDGDRFAPVGEVFEAASRGRGHYGSRLAFDLDGFLYITVGDRQVPPRARGDLESHPAQKLSDHHGVVVRLHDDGRVPADNPFVGRDGALPEIWSYGHRNSQGLAVHPETGAIWLTEHGPQGGDEVNIAVAGANYGWPVIGYGVNYGSGTRIHDSSHAPGMEQPLHYWTPSIGTSGLAFYTGDQFQKWRGNLLAGGLVGQRIDRLEVENGRVVATETILAGIGGVRDVRQGPDGLIYVALDARRGPSIVRLEPVR